jgi:hypothetical protein
MDVVLFPSKSENKTKIQKTIEEIAPYYTYNPHTPYYFKSSNIDDWIVYLGKCSDMSRGNVKSKMQFLHKRISYWWCQHRRDKTTLEFYAKHYSPSAKPEDRRVAALMPKRLDYDVLTINRRLEKNWVKPPPAMASIRYWEAFFYNCMDLNVLEKLDTILVRLLNHIDKKKEKPVEDKSRTECLNYLQKRKSEPQLSIPSAIRAKKRTW